MNAQKLLTIYIALAAASIASAQATLGSYVFNNAQFGNSFTDTDGGSLANGNWLNTVDANPGNPGMLTGAHFNTGIANIGLFGPSPTYQIGYSTAIVNGAGADLGVVVARFSADSFDFSVSQDGTNFGVASTITASTALATGEIRQYFYGGNSSGPFGANLFVHLIDLSDFGVASGASILGTRVTSLGELDLVRVAGMNAVPEPSSMIALGLGAVALLRRKATR